MVDDAIGGANEVTEPSNRATTVDFCTGDPPDPDLRSA